MITPGKSSPTSTASVGLILLQAVSLFNLIQGQNLPSAVEPKQRKGSIFAIYILKVSFLRFLVLWAQQAESNVGRLNSYKKPPCCLSHCQALFYLADFVNAKAAMEDSTLTAETEKSKA